MSVTGEIVGTHFGMYHPDEIVALSAKKVVSSETVDTLGNPVPGGLSDRAMGTADFRSICTTCNLGHSQCPGHLGHMELATPVYNPLTFTYLRSLLLAKCFSCHQFKAKDVKIALVLAKLTLIDAGLANDALALENHLFTHPVWDDLGEKHDIGSEEEEEDGDIEDENVALPKIKRYVKKKLSEAGQTPSIWRSQHSHSNDVRTEVIDEFLKTMKTPRCPRCDCMSDMIKIRGGFKVFAVPRKRGPGNAGDADATDVFEGDGDDVALDTSTNVARGVARYLPPVEVERHVKLLWKKEKAVVKRLFSSISFKRGDSEQSECVVVRNCDPSMFFIRILAVPSNRFRPPNVLGGQLMENDQTVQYQNIMKENEYLAQMTRIRAQTAGTGPADNAEAVKEFDMDAFTRSVTRLQFRVGQLIDSHSAKDLGIAGARVDGPPGIRQVLERKEGLFRMHMMGKRVNFSARSVISPDPNIETSEIGVPVHFAMKLSYPQPVTPFNAAKLRAAVINGPNKYPGANYVVDPDGNVIQLEHRSHSQRVSIARTLQNLGEGPNPAHGLVYSRKVGRHLQDGDILLVNRQPTLHKPSIMAHKAKILPGDRVIRMHYANCSTYNADFDGDEINLHFPQSELARAEGYMIASTEQQYCVPSSGMPIRGLIQDHVCGGVQLSKRGVFVTKHEYMQLVFAACSGMHGNRAVEPVQPAILKPVQRWSGKQVVSTVLKHVISGCHSQLNLESKARVKGTAWQPGGPVHEDQVIFKDSDLLTGVMDRSQFGATAYGLVHAVNELYGPEYSEKLLTALGRLFTRFFQMTGFTMGIDDCLVSKDAEKKRQSVLSGIEDLGVDVSNAFSGNKSHKRDRESVAEHLTEHMIGAGTGVDARGAKLDGAFRSSLNPVASEIVAACIPRGQVKPFPSNNLALMTVSGAKGSAVNHSQISCLLGQQDVEGRRVPRMINGKTLPCFLPFDPSPRSGGFVTQRFLTGLELPEYFFHCMAGREGLIDTAVKTSSSGYLQRCLIKHLESIRVHYDSTVRQEDGSVIQFLYGEDGLDVTKTPWLKQEKMPFFASNYQGFVNRLCVSDAVTRLNEPKSYYKKQRRAVKGKTDPVSSMYDPASTLGVTSEQFYKNFENHVKSDSSVLSGITDDVYIKAKDKYRALMSLKYMRSLVPPGESVGLLAAQSVGEPSTQMTLNTFHLAGVAEAKVTLGIPRLREILMTASKNLSAPSMVMPMLPGKTRVDALRLASSIDLILMNELVDEVEVVESVISKARLGVVRDYAINIQLKPLETIKSIVAVKWPAICFAILKRFLPALLRSVIARVKAGIQHRNAIAAQSKRAEKQRRAQTRAPAGDDDHVMGDRDGGGDGEDDGGSDSDSDIASDDDDVMGADDGDARASSRRRMHGGNYYNADEEEREFAVAESFNDRNGEGEDDEDADADEEEDEEESESDPDAATESRHKYTGIGKEYVESLRFLPSGRCSVVLSVGADLPRILMMELFMDAAQKTVVRQVPGIERCHIVNAKVSDGSERAAVQTDGVNLELAARLRDDIDVREVTCNSIHDVLSTYGVEAARASIVREVSGVFGMYGINVDHRHLSLISDYCTHGGGYHGFNRHSMHVNPSPFTRMSFETSSKFLTGATVFGESDHVASSSSCIVVGQHATVGTGVCDVRVPI